MDIYPVSVYGPLGSVERRKRLQRNSALMRDYGITYPEYIQLSEEQDNKCAICSREEYGIHRRESGEVLLSLAVDHDHDTGAVRALLCNGCNKALGLFQDNINILQRAAQYLSDHQKGE